MRPVSSPSTFDSPTLLLFLGPRFFLCLYRFLPVAGVVGILFVDLPNGVDFTGVELFGVFLTLPTFLELGLKAPVSGVFVEGMAMELRILEMAGRVVRGKEIPPRRFFWAVRENLGVGKDQPFFQRALQPPNLASAKKPITRQT